MPKLFDDGQGVLTAAVGRWCSRAVAERLANAPPIARSERAAVIGEFWRGVAPYGLSDGRLLAPGTRIEPGIYVGITQKRLIETVGDGVRFTPNSGHGAAPQQLRLFAKL